MGPDVTYLNMKGAKLNVSGDKEFVCASCGRAYKHNRNLQAHVRYECGKDPQFPCPLCPYRAKLRGTLRTHMALKH
ncbi:hypothetical protein J6590_014754 [Homalodisca vitripennis]|nr:hypothetical protein J6590_014754 [Homalodisca vitripennis]